VKILESKIKCSSLVCVVNKKISELEFMNKAYIKEIILMFVHRLRSVTTLMWTDTAKLA
jgi:hypothetical protein